MKKRIYVVVHTVSTQFDGQEHALEQVEIARNNGADGIFIIPDYAKGTGVKATTLEQLTYLEALEEEFPDFLIGVNFLRNLEEIKESLGELKADLLQTDSSSLHGIELTPRITTFCGLAFKYSPNQLLTDDKLREHCLQVAAICDVPTTSGSGTGVAADVSKIKEIVSYLPFGKRLGIASGVTEENVTSYMEAGATDFLVATSLISDASDSYHDILDERKVARLVMRVHAA